MGLDITAYRQITPDPTPAKDENGFLLSGFYGGASMHWSESCFPGRGEGIDPDTVYAYAEAFHFRAGSYSGYGRWRDHLAELGGLTAHERRYPVPESAKKPFYELVVFADNEGVIGPKVAAKLAQDFREYLPQAERTKEPWFLEIYRDWLKAFEMAADGGAVEFH